MIQMEVCQLFYPSPVLNSLCMKLYLSDLNTHFVPRRKHSLP